MLLQKGIRTMRLLRSWQTVCLLARKVGALSLIVLLLLPLVSPTSVFSSSGVQGQTKNTPLWLFYDLNQENTTDQDQSLACLWHSVTAIVSPTTQLASALRPICWLSGEEQGDVPSPPPTPRHERAPPDLVFG
jgi:hypothetical protein